ncbi:MAG: ABC transporter permease [Thermodesulfobacteriota bacterium]
MLKLIFLRFATGALVVLFVVSLTFFLLRILPGGPFDEEKQLPPKIQENLEKKYKFNEPVWKQYGIYIHSLVKGDFGPSYKYQNRSANDIIKETFPVSIQLGLAALFISVVFGISLGIVSSLSPGSFSDFGTAIISISLVSVPNFVIGAILIYIFSIKLGWLPAALWGKPANYILPALTLAAGSTAYIARLVRSNMVDASNELYIRTAKAKGLKKSSIILKHTLKNALIPVVTVLGPISAYLVTGSFVVEHIFAIPGMGRFFVFAVSNRDYSVVLAITIIYTIILVIANLIVDLLYLYLDPRIDYESKS